MNRKGKTPLIFKTLKVLDNKNTSRINVTYIKFYQSNLVLCVKYYKPITKIIILEKPKII